MMADYIRGKRAYTKWNVETENVDLDLPAESPQPQVVQPHCFKGVKRKILKVLLGLFVLGIGLLMGCYIVRPASRGLVHHWSTFQLESRVEDPYREFIRSIDPYVIQEHVRLFSMETHRAGSKEDEHLASRISNLWKTYGLPSVKTETFSVLLSLPSSSTTNQVQLVDTEGSLNISALSNNFPSTNPYIAFAPKASVQAKLVYANFGLPEDFEYLINNNVTVSGSIVIMRNGRLHRGNKVRNAQRHGAVGAILYSDPSSVVLEDHPLSPLGVSLPGDAVVHGNLKTDPGDPQTPFLPSSDGIFREPIENLNLPSIPVIPVSYNDAEILLRGLSGPQAPSHWQGKLNLVYFIGPGYLEPNETLLVNITVHNEIVQKNIYNVLATIPGSLEPDRYVILGCHHDSWTNGSSDPNSGLAILMELARAFGSLLKNGWRPHRTLIFASWDAEEFGMTGSTEWVQAHASELTHRAVVYINLDAAMTGNYSLTVSASPLLRHVIEKAIFLVICIESSCHEGYQEVFTVWKGAKEHPINVQTNKQQHMEPSIDILGSGSDFVTFMAGYGITSAHLQFVDRHWDADYPLYHTKYDIFETLSRFVDREFVASRTLAQIVGIVLMKMADSEVLPMQATDYGDPLQKEFEQFALEYHQLLQEQGISLDTMENAVMSFKTECHKFDGTDISSRDTNGKSFHLVLRQHNDRFLELERSMLLPAGVHTGNIFRHSIYGPNKDNVYQGLAFPHVRAAIVEAQKQGTNATWNEVNRQISYVIQSLWSGQEVLHTGHLAEDETAYI